MKISRFISRLTEYSAISVFNPYRDVCSAADLRYAPRIRLNNLRLLLEASLSLKVDTLWVARDLGYKGGRRTGLALTDEIHLGLLGSLFGVGLQRATYGTAVAERTAGIVWNVMRVLDRPVFLWNVFPFHPHEDENPFTNRCHTRAERAACHPILLELLDIIQPTMVLAIGNDAQHGLTDLGISACRVRHPSYGGKTEFIDGISRLHGAPEMPEPLESLPLETPQAAKAGLAQV